MNTATQPIGQNAEPRADFSLLVKAFFAFVQKGAQRLVQMPSSNWETLQRLGSQLKDASEEERVEIIETMMEVVFPEDHLSAQATATSVDSESKQRVLAYQKSIGAEIRKQRKALRWTQIQLARKAGLPQSHICRIECGRHVPSDLTIAKIAKALGVKPSTIDPGYSDE